jgi:hypothetical protein
MDYSTISSIYQGRYSVSSKFVSAFSTVSSKSLLKSTLHNAECSHHSSERIFSRVSFFSQPLFSMLFPRRKTAKIQIKGGWRRAVLYFRSVPQGGSA